MNTTNISLMIGERIKHLREMKNISQSDLSQKIDISRPVLNRIESGTRPLRDDELIKISDFFNITTDYLLGRKVDLGDTPVAAHMENNLTDEQKKDIADYIEFKKSQYKKENENKNK